MDLSVETNTHDASPPEKGGRLSVFPVFVKVEGRVAVVVGNGSEALAKARLLSESKIAVRIVAPAPDRELAAYIIQSDIDHVATPYQAPILEGAVMVFAATGERALDETIVADARARSIPVNAVDRPELCDFYTPALVNRAPVAVAIGSEGAGPVLTQLIRSRIEALLPVTLGALASLARSYRSTVERILPGGAPRRAFWRAFFAGQIADSFHAGDIAQARRHVSRLLHEPDFGGGSVALVGAGPGATDLLTLRAQRVLLNADYILHDALVPEAVIAMGRRDAHRINTGKTKGRHSMSQDKINALMIDKARKGHRVVRLKSGDPLIFGRAGEEMDALRQAGIDFEIVPGVTAALGAAAQARIPLTFRGIASSLVFATGHDKDAQTLPGWSALALSGTTVAVYMGRTVAASVARKLIAAGLGENTPVAIIEAASQPETTILSGKLSELAQLENRHDVGHSHPALILVGPALAHADLVSAEPLAGREQIIAA